MTQTQRVAETITLDRPATPLLDMLMAEPVSLLDRMAVAEPEVRVGECTVIAYRLVCGICHKPECKLCGDILTVRPYPVGR